MALAVLGCGGTLEPASDAGPDGPPELFDAAYTPKTSSPTHNWGLDCMARGCHGVSAQGNAFLIGGTVYAPNASGGFDPAANVEVRILDSVAGGMSAYSDTHGNFYIPITTVPSLTAAWVGVRTATASQEMHGMLDSTMGGCSASGCHVGGDAGGAGPVHVP